MGILIQLVELFAILWSYVNISESEIGLWRVQVVLSYLTIKGTRVVKNGYVSP